MIAEKSSRFIGYLSGYSIVRSITSRIELGRKIGCIDITNQRNRFFPGLDVFSNRPPLFSVLCRGDPVFLLEQPLEVGLAGKAKVKADFCQRFF